MKKYDAIKSKLAYDYVIEKLSPLEGKNINRLGEEKTKYLTNVWEHAREIWPDIAGIQGCSPLGTDGKTVCLDKMKRKYSRSVEYVEKWEIVGKSIAVREYLMALENLRKIKEAMINLTGITPSDLSLMGICSVEELPND